MIKTTFHLCSTDLTAPVQKRKEKQRQWTRGQGSQTDKILELLWYDKKKQEKGKRTEEEEQVGSPVETRRSATNVFKSFVFISDYSSNFYCSNKEIQTTCFLWTQNYTHVS